jgi:hypothetical protein
MNRAALAEDIIRTRNAQNRELERLGHAPTLEQQREIADIAAQHRELFADLEMSVPQPSATDRPRDYEVALLQRLQRFSPTFRETDLRRLARAGGLGGIDKQIVQEAGRIAGNKTIGSFRRPGELREVRRVDQSGQEEIRFYGNPLSWMAQFMSPVVTVVEAFNTGRRR